MAIYRQIHISFWQDPFVLDLTPEEKYFYLYLMTNSKTKQCGVYELPKKVMELETGYNRETVEKLIKRFIEYGKIEYHDKTKEIYIKNWLKYNSHKSPKVMQCIMSELSEVKHKPFKIKTMDSLSIDSGEEKEKEEEKEPEKEKEEENHNNNTPYKKIAELYHSICTSFSKVRTITDNRKKTLNARWKDYGQDLSVFEELFQKAEASDFLTGRKPNDKNWKCGGLDWLINQQNMAKVLEGKYDNQEPQQQTPQLQRADLRRIADDDPDYLAFLKEQQELDLFEG